MKENNQPIDECFTLFKEPIDSIALPDKFTFPFYYEPHPLCILAAKELQLFIENQKEWEWDFHNSANVKGICMGKMFGVLVVINKNNEIGYLAAFSGKIANKNHLSGFVPPVYDMLTRNGFYLKELKKLNELNNRIKLAENTTEIEDYVNLISKEQALFSQAILAKKEELKNKKEQRKAQRTEARMHLTTIAFEELNQTLIKESLKGKFELKELTNYWKERVLIYQKKLDSLNNNLDQLKNERQGKSAEIQERLFNKYLFLDSKGTKKGLIEIFENTIQKRPPVAAGECSAPKLLQYAFLHGMKPMAMAEFWWGQASKTSIRKHGDFYPACKSKCEPILGHMLRDIEMDENPMLVNPLLKNPIEIVYEDECIAVINKPEEFLSVPGKNMHDSVLQQMKFKFPLATGPLIVHRLDMATSGIMIIAKSKEAHKRLQNQFIKRKIKKTYIALLEGVIDENEGVIDLPLRVDLDDRPRQLVCYEHGKSATTKWKVIERINNKTRIQFYPITGRTHQLRVHAAHPLGLNAPIVGDDLYGHKANRLHLHAESIEFFHPTTNKLLFFEIKPAF